jgi:hypothetical protein
MPACHRACIDAAEAVARGAKPASLSSTLKIVLTRMQARLESLMSVSRARVAASFPLTLPQVAILAKAGRDARWRIDGRDEEAACLALWRAGLLRVNGGSGFELSLLGRAALQAQVHAGRGDAAGGSGERLPARLRPGGEAAAEAVRL